MLKPADIKGYECKFAQYIPSQYNDEDDILFIKENIHTRDGRVIPSLRMRKNFEREFGVTREGYRNHSSKKDGEATERLQFYRTNQRQMPRKIAKALGRGSHNLNLKMLARSPYLYGADITTPCLLKEEYYRKYPDLASAYSVAALDIETDVVTESDEILSVSLTFKNKAFLGVTKRFLQGIALPEERIQKAFLQYLGDIQKSRGIELEVFIADNPGHMVNECLKRAHKWRPDFIAIWNIDFDFPRLIEALENDGYDPAYALSDPKVPEEYKYFKYAKGSVNKLTASGKHMPLAPHEQWHNVIAPSSFYWIDAMSVYAMIRKAGGNESSYKLDDVLERNLGVRKLNFDFANHVKGLMWHVFMQKNYKIEYLIYNLFDTIGLELLDEKTLDLQVTFPALCGFSEFKNFNSTPKMLADDMHFFFKEIGLTIATVSDKMADELDQYVIGMNNNIITLPCHLVDDNGLSLLEEFPNIRTLLRCFVADKH